MSPPSVFTWSLWLLVSIGTIQSPVPAGPTRGEQLSLPSKISENVETRAQTCLIESSLRSTLSMISEMVKSAKAPDSKFSHIEDTALRKSFRNTAPTKKEETLKIWTDGQRASAQQPGPEVKTGTLPEKLQRFKDLVDECTQLIYPQERLIDSKTEDKDLIGSQNGKSLKSSSSSSMKYQSKKYNQWSNLKGFFAKSRENSENRGGRIISLRSNGLRHLQLAIKDALEQDLELAESKVNIGKSLLLEAAILERELDPDVTRDLNKHVEIRKFLEKIANDKEFLDKAEYLKLVDLNKELANIQNWRQDSNLPQINDESNKAWSIPGLNSLKLMYNGKTDKLEAASNNVISIIKLESEILESLDVQRPLYLNSKVLKVRKLIHEADEVMKTDGKHVIKKLESSPNFLRELQGLLHRYHKYKGKGPQIVLPKKEKYKAYFDQTSSYSIPQTWYPPESMPP